MGLLLEDAGPSNSHESRTDRPEKERESLRKSLFRLLPVYVCVCVMILPCQRGDACCQLPVRFGGCGPGKKSGQAWISPPFERRLCYTLRDASPNTQLKSTGARWTKKREKVKMLLERENANPGRAKKNNNLLLPRLFSFSHTHTAVKTHRPFYTSFYYMRNQSERTPLSLTACALIKLSKGLFVATHRWLSFWAAR